MNALPLLAAAGLLLLKQRQAAAPVRYVPVNSMNQNYVTPTAAASVLAQLVTKMTKGITTVVPSTATAQVEAAREAAAGAVKAGDSYYGNGALSYFNNTGSPAGFSAPDPQTNNQAWQMAQPLTVNPAAYASVTGDPYNPTGTTDSYPGGPVYQPASDLNMLQAFGW